MKTIKSYVTGICRYLSCVNQDFKYKSRFWYEYPLYFTVRLPESSVGSLLIHINSKFVFHICGCTNPGGENTVLLSKDLNLYVFFVLLKQRIQRQNNKNCNSKELYTNVKQTLFTSPRQRAQDTTPEKRPWRDNENFMKGTIFI